ncbi:MAG TPA: CBS domain-containing protein [Candidatus Desulfovibrio intestinavium]|uniref:CBS domain-containing protein n=2 Tax=Desulfovibrio TaxID=872 RepID=A0A9D2HND2_9BACT|nr:CBS domain-containing protein [Candidatus Desulfovibrio intestinavium]
MMTAVSTLVTCHANADFDAFAAMLAVRHLYAPCVLLFPGTQERGLQKIVANLDGERYNLRESDDIDWDAISRLVVVDTRQRDRLNHVARLLDRDNVRIEVWDHHPDSGDDVAATISHWAEVGAVTSLIVKALAVADIALDADEATLLGLGIYGDTGSFTYSSTTPADFESAAWLLTRGMRVNDIDDMAAHELTSAHVRALNSLLESARTYTINGIAVVIAEASMEHYLGDFAYLAHRLMEMEKFTVLFAIGRMEDRIQVVARSRTELINVGTVCAELGGGGHAYAASASVRNMMLNEVHDAIVRNLRGQLGEDKTARDYMSTPAVGVESDKPIRAADEIMLHFGLKAVPVFVPGTRRCCGILDAQTASRARLHGLGEFSVENYMLRNPTLLPPDAPLSELSAIIVGARQRLVPIVEHGEVLGVVTRTDLINVFANEPVQLKENDPPAIKPRNVAKIMRDRLSPHTRSILELAGNLGRKLALPVYVVGGFVRDILLDRDNEDIDLVVEGNGIELAKALAEALDGRVREHQKFMTSVVIYTGPDGEELRIDVATARLEYYEYPAALPTVELSSIKMDLFRRDFTINALAIRLDCSPYGQMVDFFGGQRDIKDGIIRVLHTLSFVEDPTRCLRAVRFEQRYGFHLDPAAERLIKNVLSLNLLDKLSSSRIYHEYSHMCTEPNPPACFLRMEELGLLKAVSPLLTLIPTRREALLRMREMVSWYHLLYLDEPVQHWLAYFLALCHNLNYEDARSVYERLGLPPQRRAAVFHLREKARYLCARLESWQRKQSEKHTDVFGFWKMLEGLGLEFLLYLMAATDEEGLQKNLSRYITQWRREKADIGGSDLIALGLRPGPRFTEILRQVLAAKLNGTAVTPEAQWALARELVQQALDDPEAHAPHGRRLRRERQAAPKDKSPDA